MNLRGLVTPCALVDLDRLEANAATMRARAHDLGVALRPHVKTHKVPAIARIQHGGVAGPITVSTLAEARAFAAAGFRDILWALPMPIGREHEALELAKGLEQLGLLVDDLDGAARIAAAGQADVWIKVDCGYGRAGVDPASAEAMELARWVHRHPRLNLRGLVTHGGHAYQCRDAEQVSQVAEQERSAVVGFATRLEEAAIPCPARSVGSTPTAVQARGLEGVTEIRPGNYAFFDAFQAAIGSCSLRDVALTVLATVIGRYPARDTLVLDAGALALSVDPGAQHAAPDCGFGALFSEDQREQHAELSLVALSQEHGKVRVQGGLRSGAFPLGSRVRIVPNHSCLAAACHPVYNTVRGAEALGAWEPVRGW